MIPVRLTLRNFLSYGETPTTLEYSGFDVACVTGENGHGKSTLVVDAVTCALWGQARGTDARGAGMDDLIRLGADEMELEFLFEVDGQLHRILRKRQRNRVSVLEFQVRHGQEWRPLTAERLQDTQERINRVLGLDYRTFVHSALVLQGRADAFTVAKPSERKEILADVLGLGEYERREALARERARECEQRAKLLERELEEGRVEAEGLPAAEAEAAAAEAALTGAREALAAARREREALEARRAALEALRTRAGEAERRLQEHERAAAELEAEAARVEARRAGWEDLLRAREEIAAVYDRWEEARRGAEALAALAPRYFALQAEAGRLREAVAAEGRRLEERRERLRREREEAAAVAARGEAAARREAEAAAALERLDALRAALAAAEGALAASIREAAAAAAALPARRRELEDLRQRYRRVAGEDMPSECPTCGAPIPPGRREELLARLRAEGEAARAEVARLEDALAAAETARNEAEARVASLRGELAAEGRLAAALSEARRDLEDARTAAARAAALAAEVAALEADLAAGRFAAAERARLSEAEAALLACGYDPAAHEALGRREQELRPLAARMEEVRRAEQALAADAELLASLRAQAAARTRAAAAERRLRDAAREEAAALEPALGALEEASRRASALEEEERALLDRRAAALARRDRLQALRARLAERERERAQLWRERGYWLELAQAYGKNGIQALIIENAIPELEHEANDLLARWSEGRLNVRLLTQGATKGGNVFETLDIIIADELGSRRYELWSGGERFRVDLALRIGLSKLLARRAGARLRLLVVDEGFGTQDAAGVERMVEALNDLRRDFDKILVITHRPELRERFPVQIEVTKDPREGSRLRLIG